MLGLRRNPLSRRNRNSLTPSIASEASSEDLNPVAPMAVVQPAQQSTTTVEPVKATEGVKINVNEVKINGVDEVTTSHNKTTVESDVSNLTTTTQFKAIYETAKLVKTRIAKDLDVEQQYFEDIDLDAYIDFIAEERLIHMPKKGSQWDRVLKAAEFFGLQIDAFGNSVSQFVSESKFISETALASCRLLLELGHHQAQALEPTFSVLYEFAILLAQTSQSRELFGVSLQIKEDLAEVYSGLVTLVGDIAIYYRQRLSNMPGKSVTIDFDAAFSKSINSIWRKREHLTNHIWSFKLRNKHYSLPIESVRHKLSPIEESLRALLRSRLADKHECTEGTCNWIQDYLLTFLRNEQSVFTITGPAGFGKSMLCGWMIERLQRPLGRKSYETLSYTFAADAPVEATPLSFLKSILAQLLERNVGDVRLYESLVKAFETHSALKDPKALEHALWDALEVGLATVNDDKRNLIIFVDGTDEVHGGHAKELVGHLLNSLQKFKNKDDEKLPRIRAVTMSRQTYPLKDPACKEFRIESAHTYADIATYLHHGLTQNTAFKAFEQARQRDFIHQLASKAQGSFLWAYVVVKLLATEKSQESFLNLGKSMSSNIQELLPKLLGKVDLKDARTKHMFAFMLVAERPLSIVEMTDLLSLNLQNRTITSKMDVRGHVQNNCAGLVVERKGLIRFRHSVIRKFLAEHCEKSLMSTKDAHRELTMRLLLFAKCSLSVHSEPSFDLLSSAVIEEVFATHRLMEYVVRNWLIHFQHSSLHGKQGELHLTSDFKEVFPDSTFFAMIEWFCWQNQTTTNRALELHETALKLRSACFGDKHQSVMQVLIILGTFHRTLSHTESAAEFFYRASCVGQVVLHKFSTVVLKCTELVLTCTETIIITKRTKIVTYREEMIRFMIEICKVRYGPQSDVVIRWYEILAKLYVDIKEDHHAHAVYKELYQLIVIRFGTKSPRAGSISKALGGLQIVLNEDEAEHDVVQYDEFILETSEELPPDDELRVSIVLRLAYTYECRHNWILAEKLYISLWRRISEICRIKASVEIHLAKINIAIAYVKFLQRVKREEEASNILICLWAEYKHHHFDSELLIMRFKEIGILFRTFGLLDAAISIFGKIWGWFKGKGKAEHEEGQSITVLITEVIEEITETKTTTKTTITQTVEVTETLVRDIYETTYTRCKHTKVDAAFFRACISLINLYTKLQKWSEAEVVIKRSLEITWKAVLTAETKITLTGSFVSDCIVVATRLAICYHKQRQFERAEEIYLRIYRACLASFNIDHVHVTEASLALIKFYEEYHRHDKVIEIYLELLQGYRKQLGATHKLTIQTLYALGSLYMLLGRKDAYQYYIEIVTVLNKGKHCHHDAFEAALVVCGYYHEEKRWDELQKICVILWETFLHHHHEHKFTEEIVQVIYERYRYTLEVHAKVEFDVLYKLTIQYRETVTKVFGSSAAIVITAMLALAELCEKHEKHIHESVTIYEEVITRITTTKTTVGIKSETTVETVKKRLSKVYVTIIVNGKSTNTTTIEKGIAICLEIYEKLKVELGCWHESTLAKLKEVVLLYKKLGNHEATITRLLQLSVIEIITKVTTSMTLYTAATTLASIYVAVGMLRAGHELLHQLRHLIVLHDLGSSEQITIKLDAKVSNVAFVFLIAFEYGLNEKTVLTFSEIMADILMETYLYEQYVRVLSTETKIEVILEYGAKLRCFWSAHGRSSNIAVLDKRILALFKSRYSTCFSGQSEATIFTFYVALCRELGVDRSSVDFAVLACVAGNHEVRSLLDAGEFKSANALAKCVFQFSQTQRFYHLKRCFAYGYKLAELVAGVDVAQPTETKDREDMLVTSRAVLHVVLEAFRESGYDFVHLQFKDLVGLIRLLGYQHNFTQLESILLSLWRSREVQRTWSSHVVLQIGSLLVHARACAGHLDDAISLCDTLCYNVRRSRGWLDPQSLDLSERLASLCRRAGRNDEAMRVHEEVLREIDEVGDSKEYKRETVKSVAERHFDDLRQTVKGADSWGHRSEKDIGELYDRLKRFGGFSVSSPPKWKQGAKDEVQLGPYTGPKEWLLTQNELNVAKGGMKRGTSSRSASERWVCGGALVYKPEVVDAHAVKSSPRVYH